MRETKALEEFGKVGKLTRNGTVGKIAKDECGQMFIGREYSRVYELKEYSSVIFAEKPYIRIYRSQAPNVFELQIRGTFKTCAGGISGKEKYMLATANLTIAEVEEILKYMKEEKSK